MSAVRHWRWKWLGSAALAPLSLWFLAALVGRDLGSAAAFAAWLREPGAAVLLSLFLLVSLHHSWLGLGAIVDDYVASPARNRLAHAACRAALLGSAALAAAGVLRLTLGG